MITLGYPAPCTRYLYAFVDLYALILDFVNRLVPRKLKASFLFTEPETSYEEEMQILRVIEAYCNLSNAKTQRHTFSATSEYYIFELFFVISYPLKKLTKTNEFSLSISFL